MGTRHLIAVQIDGEYKIAQYGQWDGYPRGQGIDVLAFISKVMADTAALEMFKSKLRTSSWVDLGEAQLGLDKLGEKFWANYPWLSRDCGSDVLDMVLESNAPMALQNSIDFAMDSLFCEWAYVIDFDSNTFEAARTDAERATERERLRAALRDRQDASLKALSEEDLQKRLRELGG